MSKLINTLGHILLSIIIGTFLAVQCAGPNTDTMGFLFTVIFIAWFPILIVYLIFERFPIFGRSRWKKIKAFPSWIEKYHSRICFTHNDGTMYFKGKKYRYKSVTQESFWGPYDFTTKYYRKKRSNRQEI